MLPMEPRDSFVTTSEPETTRLGADVTNGRGRAKALLRASLLAALGVTLVACSSNSTSASTTDAVINQSGKSSKTISSVELPKKWTVTWKFDCTNPVSARRFVLTATEAGSSPIAITDQTGIGGGGTKSYNQTGTFDFTITTTCTWNLLLGPWSSSPTTTTP